MAAIYALANGIIQQVYSTWEVEQVALAGAWPLQIPSAPVGPGTFSIGAGQFILTQSAPFTPASIPAPIVIEFDESTNAALIADIVANFALYSAPNGTLEKSGKAVTIAASSAIYAARAALVKAVPSASLQTIFAALNAGTATNAQIQQALAYIMTTLYTQGNLAIPATTASATQPVV